MPKYLTALTICLAFLALAAAPAYAGSGPALTGESFARLSKALELAPEQQAKIQALYQEAAQGVRAVLADQALTPAARKTRVREIQAATQVRIYEILTPEQRQKLATLQMAAGEKRLRRQARTRQARIYAQLAKALQLTEEQKTQAKQIFAEAAKQIQAAAKDESLAPAARQAKVRAIRAAAQVRFFELLTPAQRQKLLALRAEAGDRAKGQRRSGKDGGPAKLIRALNLTPEQQEKIRAIRAEAAEKIGAVLHDPALSPEIKKAKVKELKEQALARIKELLTPEQRRKLEGFSLGEII